MEAFWWSSQTPYQHSGHQNEIGTSSDSQTAGRTARLRDIEPLALMSQAGFMDLHAGTFSSSRSSLEPQRFGHPGLASVTERPHTQLTGTPAPPCLDAQLPELAQVLDALVPEGPDHPGAEWVSGSRRYEAQSL